MSALQGRHELARRYDAAPKPRADEEPKMVSHQSVQEFDDAFAEPDADTFEVDDALEIEDALEVPKEEHAARGGGGWVQFIFGTVLLGGAATLALAPEFSWRLTKIGEELQGYGVETGVLMLAGLIFFGLGFGTRSANRAATKAIARIPQPEPPPPASSDSDFLLVADQLATDLAQVLTSLLQISEELTGVGASQRLLVKKVIDDAQPTEEEHNAVFRLAASVDKLNAHIDERLHGFDVQFRSRFESVTNAVHEARMALEARIDQMSAAVPAAAAPPAAPDEPEFASGEPEFASGEPSMEFFERIEADSGPSAMPAMDPSAPIEQPGPALPSSPEIDQLDVIMPDDGEVDFGPLG